MCHRKFIYLDSHMLEVVPLIFFFTNLFIRKGFFYIMGRNCLAVSLVIKLGTQLEVALQKPVLCQPTTNSWLALARSSQADIIIKLIMKAVGFRESHGMHYTKWSR